MFLISKIIFSNAIFKFIKNKETKTKWMINYKKWLAELGREGWLHYYFFSLIFKPKTYNNK